jgi:RNA polymerase sigma-70 factor (ECF subfamily)
LRSNDVNVLQAQPMSISHARVTEVSDRELVEQALAEPAAFLAIFQRYRDPVHRYCYRCLGNREAAEDATQTTFLRTFANLKKYEDRGQFRSWLFAIAHNVIIDTRRSAKPVDSLEWADQIADTAASPEDLAIASTEILRITALLDKLPSSQREVVELRLQGLTDKEIAGILGKSHEAIRAAQHRALIQLRSLMGVGPTKEAGHVER